MKQFSIHKVNKPMMRHAKPAGEGDESKPDGFDYETGEFMGPDGG